MVEASSVGEIVVSFVTGIIVGIAVALNDELVVIVGDIVEVPFVLLLNGVGEIVTVSFCVILAMVGAKVVTLLSDILKDGGLVVTFCVLLATTIGEESS